MRQRFTTNSRVNTSLSSPVLSLTSDGTAAAPTRAKPYSDSKTADGSLEASIFSPVFDDSQSDPATTSGSATDTYSVEAEKPIEFTEEGKLSSALSSVDSQSETQTLPSAGRAVVEFPVLSSSSTEWDLTLGQKY